MVDATTGSHGDTAAKNNAAVYSPAPKLTADTKAIVAAINGLTSEQIQTNYWLKEIIAQLEALKERNY